MGKKLRVIRLVKGKDLILLCGLPRDSLRAISNEIESDDCVRPSLCYGLPAAANDWHRLYPQNAIKMLIKRIGGIVAKHEKAASGEKIPTPRRILLLYVPSFGVEELLESLDFICYATALEATADEWNYGNGSAIGWRHDENIVRSIIFRTLDRAIKKTNALKVEIADKRNSSFRLPARNFYYPNKTTAIFSLYRQFARHDLEFLKLKDELVPKSFTRDQLHGRAFRGSAHRANFFQDCQERVFVLDQFHAPPRTVENLEPMDDKKAQSDDLKEVLLVLRQLYRFGVFARNGKLHYDVQFELPRILLRERMHCARIGQVLVTGSHANVGINDFIWVPDGKKVQNNTA